MFSPLSSGLRVPTGGVLSQSSVVRVTGPYRGCSKPVLCRQGYGYPQGVPTGGVLSQSSVSGSSPLSSGGRSSVVRVTGPYRGCSKPVLCRQGSGPYRGCSKPVLCRVYRGCSKPVLCRQGYGSLQGVF